MSQNCKSTYSASPARDANNNTLYHAGAPACPRRYTPPTGNYQQVTAKVLFGSMTAINDLKVKENAEREARRTH
ncbi:hypothetical protein JYU34_013079 [Plutella xylostella]|uniref:Uncharacterized protein n=1 Tax=Plutella xylostella TaxID=51655 RepID=A0ABQ7QE63_PLUXY|nr:hypothetical protein JYU34_013079 [Plutella xylostella]